VSSPLDLASELIRSFAVPAGPAESHHPRVGAAEPVRRGSRPRPALGDGIGFPPETRPRSGLLTTLRNRRSIRFFARDPIPAALLADIAARGLADDEWWETEHGCCPLSVDVAAFRVTGLEPAFYHLDPLTRSFIAVASLPSGDAVRELTIQEEFCDAAAITMITGDVEHAAQAHGGHGYRLLMSRAGAAAYAMWLDAVASGLAGTVFAGFIPSSIRLPLHCDGSSRHQLFALALGTPAEAANGVAGGVRRQRRDT